MTHNDRKKRNLVVWETEKKRNAILRQTVPVEGLALYTPNIALFG